MTQSHAPDPSLPDLLLIGAMKAATSTISNYLENHPDVFMAPNCEPHFFAHDDKWERGVDWYRQFFVGYGGERLVGEGSNGYSNRGRLPHAAQRAASVVPNAKIIYSVRHPVDRIKSAWLQYRADQPQSAPPSLDAAILEHGDAYLKSSQYWFQLQAWREYYPDDQILVLFLEDLKTGPDAFYGALEQFLGLTPHRVDIDKVVNPSAGKKVPNANFDRLNRSGAVKTIAKALVPAGLRRKIIKTFLTSELEQKPDFSDPVRRQVVDALRDDMETFLRHCGKPADYWSLD